MGGHVGDELGYISKGICILEEWGISVVPKNSEYAFVVHVSISRKWGLLVLVRVIFLLGYYLQNEGLCTMVWATVCRTLFTLRVHTSGYDSLQGDRRVQRRMFTWRASLKLWNERTGSWRRRWQLQAPDADATNTYSNANFSFDDGYYFSSLLLKVNYYLCWNASSGQQSLSNGYQDTWAC